MVREAGRGRAESEAGLEEASAKTWGQNPGDLVWEPFERPILDAQSIPKRFICPGMKKGTTEILPSIQLKSK